MATFTSFLGLRKPSASDNVNVTLDLSDNLDAIDAKLEELTDFLELAGILFPYGGSVAPTGFFMADGSAVSRTVYSKTFAICGTTFGAGNGVSTFNLPNVKGRTLVGLDGSQTEFNVLGKTGGAKTHTLTIAEMPSHNHPWRGVNDSTTVSGSPGSYPFRIYQDALDNWQGSQAYMQNTGGGGAHNNLQPYLALNWIMRAV